MIHSLAIISPDMQQRIGQQNITFTPGINIVVGSNGTGKSSLINLITEITSGNSENGRLIWDPTVPVHTYNAEQLKIVQMTRQPLVSTIHMDKHFVDTLV